jgi:hypothetical protein
MNESAPLCRLDRMRVRHFYPLFGFLVPTLAIGYGLLIPRSCIAGWNVLTLGFASTVIGAAVTYWAGVRLALRAASPGGRDALR